MSNGRGLSESEFRASTSELAVPTIEISFDTPNRDRFLRDDFHNKRGSYSILGRGSYGVVIRASYRGRPVAVKILEKRLHRQHRQRYDSLLNEANALRLRHENIVTVLKVVSGTQYGLVLMERFDGHCLQHILLRANHRSIGIQHKLLILCDIINGLNFCHRHQLVHLDVKPQNVIVTLSGAGPGATPDHDATPGACLRLRKYLCKLCDFGSSVALTSWQRGVPLVNRGTIRYMAPELLRSVVLGGGVTPRADIYSFGVTMWQLNEERPLPYEEFGSNEVVAYHVVKKGLRPDSASTALGSSGPRFRAMLTKNRCLHGSLLLPVVSLASARPVNVFESDAVDDVLKRQGIAVERNGHIRAVRKISLGAIGGAAIGGCSGSGDDEAGGGSKDELTAKRIDSIFCDHFAIPGHERAQIGQAVRALYSKCWLTEPSGRPDAATVRATIHQLLGRIAQCRAAD
ncbi:proto-oncogene serine/threonine-protein kinase mos [Anopheles cruzii]|uniref:proto-oncogene serine/threonine-protein kinase mos n=1 Tax=Anopheles cruzii TaxID=68878 RepID=UPI0022EC9516|nr:proto-oncogene serine/threonine-protein kinase mos [Anopheles cruzii]